MDPREEMLKSVSNYNISIIARELFGINSYNWYKGYEYYKSSLFKDHIYERALVRNLLEDPTIKLISDMCNIFNRPINLELLVYQTYYFTEIEGEEIPDNPEVDITYIYKTIYKLQEITK